MATVDKENKVTLAAVLTGEHRLIIKRRKEIAPREPDWKLVRPRSEKSPHGKDGQIRDLRVNALRNHVTGLAISGGGIRSATFAVGFLQGLAALGLIRRFDYLSTVSGGGYAGAWLTAWLKREGGDPEKVSKMLNSSRIFQAEADRQLLKNEVVDEEPEALRHLRAHSRYLFPHHGILSPDTWTVILIWLRNVTINLMMILPAIMILVASSRIVLATYRYFNYFNPPDFTTSTGFCSHLGLALGVALFCWSIACFYNDMPLRAITLLDLSGGIVVATYRHFNPFGLETSIWLFLLWGLALAVGVLYWCIVCIHNHTLPRAIPLLIFGFGIVPAIYYFNPRVFEMFPWLFFFRVLALGVGLLCVGIAFFYSDKALQSVRNSDNSDQARRKIGTPGQVQEPDMYNIIISMAIAAFLLTATGAHDMVCKSKGPDVTVAVRFPK